MKTCCSGFARITVIMGFLIGSSVMAQHADSCTDSIPGTGVEFQMRLVPGGTFLMGSPENESGRDADEGPQRPVQVDSFWMAATELTFDEYEVFRQRRLDESHPTVSGQTYDADAVTRPSPPYEDPSFGMGTHGYPASSMTQYAALRYCEWLSSKTGEFYRLPTEAEWEFAARAGTATPWFFGEKEDSLENYAWYYGNSNGVFHPVGEKAPNPLGLFDVYGNVAEWTLDQYQADFLASLTDSLNVNPFREPVSLHPRTVKGGSYDSDPPQTRSAERLRSSKDWQKRDPQIPKSIWWNTDAPFVGFRIVKPVHPPTPEEQTAFWKMVFGN